MPNDPLLLPVTAPSIRLPSYRLHKATGLAVVTIRGRDVYLGRYGSAESRADYDRVIAEYHTTRGITPEERERMTVSEFVLHYWRHAQAYYPKSTLHSTIRPTLRRLRRLFGTTRVADFGPLRLKAFRTALLAERVRGGARLTRRYINDAVAQVRAFFKWGVGEELVPAHIYQGLLAVEGLRAGRTDAPDPPPVMPVPDRTVELTLEHLCPTVADMIRVQRLTGMRPGEVCSMTAAELDMSGNVWMYRPSRHKTAHHGKSRVVMLGPKAQAIVARYLTHELAGTLFRPSRAVAEQHAAQRAANKTPFTPSRLKRDAARGGRPRRNWNDAYTTTNYAQAIRRACDLAGIPQWSPNQLRHTRATELRKEFGLDAAGAVLGHSRLETTQIYAEKNMDLAAKVALATG